MEIDEIVDYATKSPENTNPAVLRSMLSQLNSGSSGSGGDVMYARFVYESDEAEDPTCDKSFDELMGWALQHKPIIAFFTNGVMSTKTNLTMGPSGYDYDGVQFTFMSSYIADTLSLLTVTVNPDNSLSHTYKEYALTPTT